MVHYIIKSTIGIAIAYSVYYTLLRNSKSFVFIRFFLLCSLLLSIFFPIVRINVPAIAQFLDNVYLPLTFGAEVHSQEVTDSEMIKAISTKTSYIKYGLIIFHISGCIILLGRYLFNLGKIISSMSKEKIKKDGLQIVLHNRKAYPYSFFNYVFLHKAVYLEKDAAIYLTHEKAHSIQFHTLDLLMAELICCFLWMNPFVWLLKRAIVINHECLADKYVIQQGVRPKNYMQLILKSLKRKPSFSLLNTFSFLRIKKRIIMLQNSASISKFKLFKAITAIVIVVGSISLTSFVFQENKQQYVVLIDPGHGGQDNGAENGQILEKDINLTICNKILERNKNNKVKYILTRTTDEFISLAERVDIAKRNEVDLFLSVHCNFSENTELCGPEAYFNKTGNFKLISQEFCEQLIQEQINNYIAEEGRVKSAGFRVLEGLSCPGAVLQVGFLSSPEDIAKLSDNSFYDRLSSAINISIVKNKKSFSHKDK